VVPTQVSEASRLAHAMFASFADRLEEQLSNDARSVAAAASFVQVRSLAGRRQQFPREPLLFGPPLALEQGPKAQWSKTSLDAGWSALESWSVCRDQGMPLLRAGGGRRRDESQPQTSL
jgi:hypothetical protein